MAKKKEHQKTKYQTIIISPDKTQYKQSEVELRQCFGSTGKKLGMFWCGNNIRFRKIYNDQVRTICN